MGDRNKKDDYYFPLSRKYFDHIFWQEKREYSKAEAWLDLLQEARFAIDGEGKRLINDKLIKWGYGELPASIRYLKKRWNWRSKTKVKNFLDLLKNEDMITTRVVQGETIVTICNYRIYDPKNTETGTADSTGGGHQKDSKRTVRGQQEDKEEERKESKESNTTSPNSAEAEPDVQSDLVSDQQKLDKRPLATVEMNEFSEETIEGKMKRLTVYLWKSLKREYPTGNKTLDTAKFGNWYHPIRKMVELDNRTVEEILEMWKWTRTDSFWKTNILSPVSLRDKFDRLLVKRQEQKANGITTGKHRKEPQSAQAIDREIDQFYQEAGLEGI